MIITTYGTRGSIPIANPDAVRYGGNTTCLRIESSALQPGHALIVDAGSGIVPLGGDLVKEGVSEVTILCTHYHHDHTQGLLLCPLTFMPNVIKHVTGTLESEVGPHQMLMAMMKPPFFPKAYAEVQDHFKTKAIEHPSSMIMIAHPIGGWKTCKVNELCAYEKAPNAQVPFGKEGKFSLNECLVIRMLYSNHPERTISYRFEERSTGSVFVFLTDHENQAGMPLDLRNHLGKADLLIMDSQYDLESYLTRTAGFGHGTPDYCVRVANEVGAKRLGLTHHDPRSMDQDIDNILALAKQEATQVGYQGDIIACADYGVIEL